MADLGRSDLDLETDSAPLQLRREHGQMSRMLYSSDPKQPSTMEERVDSGVGYSLESQDLSALSFECMASDAGRECRKHFENYTTSSSTSDNITTSLQSHFRNLSIGDADQTTRDPHSVKSNRCDSGICDSGVFSVEESFGLAIQSAFPECHLQSTVHYESAFSAQELEELFSQDEDGDTHLHMSIIHLLPEVSFKIISMAPSHECINIPNNLHQTPLHLAIATQQFLVARRLMVAGASLDAPDYSGNTPLHIACREGMVEMVRFLLSPVLNEETQVNSYRIPLQRIPQDFSIRNYDGYTCAHLALQGRHLNILQILLANGANVNEIDGKSGRTLLHMAADMGYTEALDLLIRQPSLNLNARTYGGLTAILLAHGRRLNAVVEFLYHSGADFTQVMEDPADSTDEDMNDNVYDDICINGQPISIN